MKIPCWIEIHRRMKWRMARRITVQPKETWTSKIFDWHPGLDSKIKTRRSAGRPKRRWEDDIYEFMRPGETKDERKDDLKNNSSWMTEAKNCKERKEREENKRKRGSNFWIDVPNLEPECFAFTRPEQSEVSARDPHECRDRAAPLLHDVPGQRVGCRCVLMSAKDPQASRGRAAPLLRGSLLRYQQFE